MWCSCCICSTRMTLCHSSCGYSWYKQLSCLQGSMRLICRRPLDTSSCFPVSAAILSPAQASTSHPICSSQQQHVVFAQIASNSSFPDTVPMCKIMLRCCRFTAMLQVQALIGPHVRCQHGPPEGGAPSRLCDWLPVAVCRQCARLSSRRCARQLQAADCGQQRAGMLHSYDTLLTVRPVEGWRVAQLFLFEPSQGDVAMLRAFERCQQQQLSWLSDGAQFSGLSCSWCCWV
jgi:hypothetical protein